MKRICKGIFKQMRNDKTEFIRHICEENDSHKNVCNQINIKRSIIDLRLTFLLLLGFVVNISITANIKIEQNQSLSLAELIEVVEEKEDYYFSYSNDVETYLNNQIDLEEGTYNISELTEVISKNVALSCEIIGQSILLFQPEVEKVTISGTVYESSTGEQLPGVMIAAINGTTGTVTDFDGNFSFIIDSNDSLRISFIGFVNQIIPVKKGADMQIYLEDEMHGLNEVVVTALGITREQKKIGHAITKIDNELIQQGGSTDMATVLAGKVPGMQVNTAAAGPGGSSRIVLRGEASLSLNNNEALIVVDGVPINNTMTGNGGSAYLGGTQPVDYGNGLSDINPDDVENISVLKGPNAAALYGSRAANGVVLITTKMGSKGKGVQVAVNSSYMIEEPNRNLDKQLEYGSGKRAYHDYYSYGTSPYGANTSSSHAWGPAYEGQYYYQYDSPRNVDGTYLEPTEWKSYGDPQDMFYNKGYTMKNNVTISSGDDENNFRGSITHTKNEWIMPNTGQEQLTISLNTKQKLSEKSSVSLITNYYHRQSDNLPTGGYNKQSVPYAILWSQSNEDLAWYQDYWAPGEEGRKQKELPNDTSDNPYFIAHEHLNESSRDRLLSNVKFDHKFTDKISFFARTGIDFSAEERYTKRPWDTRNHLQGMYREQKVNSLENNTDFLFTGDLSTGDWDLAVNFGGSYMYQKYSNMRATAEFLRTPGVYNLDNSLERPISYSYRSQKAVGSVYGMAHAGYKDFWFVDVTARNDWSSTLAMGNNSYFYPSLSTSLIVSDAVDWFDNSALTFWKIRSSIAQVGNDTKPYQLENYYANHALDGSYTNPNTLLNEDLMPEITNSFEVGTDIGFFNNRINLDLTWYVANTHNQIVSMPVDNASGFSAVIMNGGHIRNKGFETVLNVKAIAKKNFNWSVSTNWSTNSGEVVELLPGVVDNYVMGSHIANRVSIEAQPGDPLGNIYGLGYARDDFGNIIFKDGLAEKTDERILLGNIFPDFRGGIHNEFRYKNVTLGFQFDYQVGGQAYSLTHSVLAYTGRHVNTLEGRTEEGIVGVGVRFDEESRSFVPNDEAVGAAYYYNSMYERDQVEGNIFDTSYLKFRELRIQYNLPSRWMQSTALSRASVSFLANNLFIWTNFPGYDPEAATLSDGAITPGVETGGFPSTRSYGVSVNLTF